MAEDPHVIREQMEQTRASLSEKIEALEQHVVETVQGATGAVTETVDTIKEAAQETVGTVKETVQETVNNVREAFDVPLQFRRRPWLMLGGSLLVGYLAGTMLERRRVPRPRRLDAPVADSSPAGANGLPRTSNRPEPAPEPARPTAPGFAAKLGTALQPEFDRLKGLALGAGMGVLRDLVTNSVHGEIGGELRQIIDDVTERLGGTTFKQPILAKGSADEEVAYQPPPARAAGVGRY